MIRPVLGPGLCQTGLGLARLSKIFPPPFLSKASNKTSHPIAKPTVQRGRLRSTRRSSALAGGEPPTFRKPLPVQGNLQRQVCKDFLASHGYIHNTGCDEEVRGHESHFLGFPVLVVLVVLGIFSSEVGAEWFTTLGRLP